MNPEFFQDGNWEKPELNLEEAITDYIISLLLIPHLQEGELLDWHRRRISYLDRELRELGVLSSEDMN